MVNYDVWLSGVISRSVKSYTPHSASAVGYSLDSDSFFIE